MNRLSEYFFNILGVTRKSSKDEIKKAYRNKIKQWHPDKFPNDKQKILEATEKSKLIIEAYSILKDYELPKTKDYSPEGTAGEDRTDRGAIIRIRVKSSNIHSIGYDIESKILQIQFNSGYIYEYYEVQENIFKDFMKAESKGKYAGKYIFSSYHYKRVG